MVANPCCTWLMAVFLSQEEAKNFDQWLMSPKGGSFSLSQLMELAGLTVATIIHKYYPRSTYSNIFIAIGPGNNGGDGLVAARHLAILNYSVTIYIPKADKQPSEFFQSLITQCVNFGVQITSELDDISHYDLLVDALFGFGFRGNLKEPFMSCLNKIICTRIPIVSIDCPSGWTAEACTDLKPQMLISLTAPKECAKHFIGKYHILGCRFIPKMLPKEFEKLSYINEMYNETSDLFVDIS